VKYERLTNFIVLPFYFLKRVYPPFGYVFERHENFLLKIFSVRRRRSFQGLSKTYPHSKGRERISNSIMFTLLYEYEKETLLKSIR